MKLTKNNTALIRAFTAILLLGLFLSHNIAIYALTYVLVYLIMIARAVMTPSTKRMRFALILTYSILLALQLTYMGLVIFADNYDYLISEFLVRLLGTLFVLFPWAIEGIFTSRKQAEFMMPSIHEFSTISMTELKENREKIIAQIDNIKKSGEILSTDNISEIISDLPRHDSFKYINNGSLTDEYFSAVDKSLDDEHIYIILSDTGSPASGLISMFTGKSYNHVSISFDKDLKTIISYNGGEKVYPPGLNQEMLDFFNKKKDASILIYRIEIPQSQKILLVEKIKQINEEGSAYNMLGLATKYSHKPNILFCSQFVYKMLKYADIEYFDKKDAEVRPTDFVELDYHRKLEYVSEIKLNS